MALRVRQRVDRARTGKGRRLVAMQDSVITVAAPSPRRPGAADDPAAASSASFTCFPNDYAYLLTSRVTLLPHSI